MFRKKHAALLRGGREESTSHSPSEGGEGRYNRGRDRGRKQPFVGGEKGRKIRLRVFSTRESQTGKFPRSKGISSFGEKGGSVGRGKERRSRRIIQEVSISPTSAFPKEGN